MFSNETEHMSIAGEKDAGLLHGHSSMETNLSEGRDKTNFKK